MKIVLANKIAPDGMPRFAASHLGRFCLPRAMSHKKVARLIWVNRFRFDCTSKIGVEKSYFKKTILHFFPTLEAST